MEKFNPCINCTNKEFQTMPCMIGDTIICQARNLYDKLIVEFDKEIKQQRVDAVLEYDKELFGIKCETGNGIEYLIILPKERNQSLAKFGIKE